MFARRLALLLGLTLASPLSAFEKGDRIVVTAKPTTKADGDGVTFGYGASLHVIAVESNRLRVRSWNKIGTVSASEIIPQQDAVAYFTQQIAVASTPVEFTARGKVHALNEDNDKAIADFNRALEMNQEYLPAILERIDVRFEMRDIDHVSRDARDAVRLKPDDDETLELQILAHDIVSRPPELMKLYRQLIQRRPSNFAARNNLAKLLIDVGRDDEALVELNEAIRLFSEYSDAYTNRGIVHHRRRNMDLAIKDATSAIECDPKNSSGWNNRANAYLELKRFDDAERDFREMAKLKGCHVDGHSGLSNTFYLAEKFDEALVEIDIVIKSSPTYMAHNTRGNILRAQKKLTESIAAYNDAVAAMLRSAAMLPGVELRPIERLVGGESVLPREVVRFPVRLELATILGNRADGYRQLSNDDPSAKEKMYADLTRAITLHPENYTYRLARGQQRYNDADYQRALDDFDAAVEIQADQVDALWGGCLAAKKLNQLDKARRAAQRVQKLGHRIDQEFLKSLEESK